MDGAVDNRPGGVFARAAVEGASTALALLMDELSHAVLVASAKGQLLHANQVARDELARRRVLALHEGCLYATDERDGRVLVQALARAETGLRSLIALRAKGAGRVSVAVVPLHAPTAPAGPSVALVFSRATVCDALMLCFFARNHGLTPTEEQVLAILCQGYSAPQVAVQLRVAVSTVRSHVRSMCTKTHSNGVRALVGQVAVLPPLVSPRLQDPLH
jgi:DNA-binding HTH domain-containing proteins